MSLESKDNNITIEQKLIKVLKFKAKERRNFFFISIIGIIVSFSLVFSDKINISSVKGTVLLSVISIIGMMSISLFAISITAYFEMLNDTESENLEILAKERKELTERIKDNNIIDIIGINLNQLDEYYTINKVQAKRSYSFSIVMIVIGFIVLILSIMLWFLGKISLNITIIATLSGLIAEFIGATSLLLYKESTKQIQLFFEKLSYLQHTMLAIELTERLNEEKRDEQIAVIISSLIEKIKLI